MKKINLSGITGNIALISSVELAIGLILLLRPEGFTTVIIIALGAVLMLLGFINSVNYFRTEKTEAMKTNMLSKGLLCLIVGAFFAFNSKWFIRTFPIATVFYAVLMLLLGVAKLQNAADYFRFKIKYWYIALISSVLSIFSAVTVMTNPFTSTDFVWRFIAAVLIAEAALDILCYILKIKNSK